MHCVGHCCRPACLRSTSSLRNGSGPFRECAHPVAPDECYSSVSSQPTSYSCRRQSRRWIHHDATSASSANKDKYGSVLPLVCPLAARQTAYPGPLRVERFPHDVCRPKKVQSPTHRESHEHAEHPSLHRLSRTADHQNPYSTLTVLRPSQHIGNAPAFTLTSSIPGHRRRRTPDHAL